MKKKKVVKSLMWLLFLGLTFGCQFTGSHHSIDVEQVMQDYLDGKVIISVEEAYEKYDADTAHVVFLDVRDAISFQNQHEPGAINVPANRVQELVIGDLPDAEKNLFLIYSSNLKQSLDAWFALKQKQLSNVVVIRGRFDPGVGMLMDVPDQPSVDYAEAFASAKERLTVKPPPPPPPAPPPKKQVKVQKKKAVVEEEEEGC